jgi:hypothetical protein
VPSQPKDPAMPPPFVVGCVYRDREGEYTVISVSGDQLVIERPSGLRLLASAATKARIYSNMVLDATCGTGAPPRRPGSTPKRERMILAILSLESNGAAHTGIDIDEHLRARARDLGYSDEEVTAVHTRSHRGVFANDVDWAKSIMTSEKLHDPDPTSKHTYVDAEGERHHCKVYRITTAGLAELDRLQGSERQ